MRYIKSRHVSLIKAFDFHGMYHISLSEAYIIIYLLYMAYIIIYLLYMAYMNIINRNESRIKPYEHKNFLRGNPMTGEKTTEASLSSKITLPDSILAGATTPYNYFTSLLLEWATTLIYNDFPAPTERGYNPYKSTM